MSSPCMYRIRPVFNLTGEFKHTSSMYKLGACNMSTCTMRKSSTVRDSLFEPSVNETDVLCRQGKLLDELSVLQEQLKLISVKLNIKKPNQETSNNSNLFEVFQEAGFLELVINADPKYPPYALLWLSKLWNLSFNISTHLHSTVSTIPESLKVFNSLHANVPSQSVVNITFIWKEVGRDAQLIISPVKNKVILGEVNILRFFEAFASENEDLFSKIRFNEILDVAHRLNHVSGKDTYAFVSKLGNLLGNSNSFSQKLTPTIVDVAVWSVLFGKTKENALPSNLKNFVSSYSQKLGIN